MTKVLVAAITCLAAAAAGCASSASPPPVAVSTFVSETGFAAEFTQTMTGTELSSSADPSATTAAAVQLAITTCRLIASGDVSPARPPEDNAPYLDDVVDHLRSSYPVSDNQIRQGLILQARFECPDYLDILTTYDQWAAGR